jgi:hypothetical protein
LASGDQKVKRSEQKKEELKRAIKRVQMGKKAWTATDKSKDSKKDFPAIKILAERKVKMIELDVDIPKATKNILIDIAREYIVKDEKALLNYAFSKCVKDGLKFFSKK